jgi:hypothetical protein
VRSPDPEIWLDKMIRIKNPNANSGSAVKTENYSEDRMSKDKFSPLLPTG